MGVNSEEVVTRREFDGFCGRISKEVEQIQLSVTKMEIMMNSMSEIVKRIDEAIFGKGGGEGMIIKMTKLSSVQQVQVWLVGLLMAGVLGIAWYILQKGIHP